MDRWRCVAVVVLLAGCSSSPPPFRDDSGTPDTGPMDAVEDVADEEPVDRPPIPIRDTGPTDMTIVFAHSDTALYSVDPRTSTVTLVHAFVFPSSDTHNHDVTDIAVDAMGGMVGTTEDALYRIDPATAGCTFIATVPAGQVFSGLTYLPAGVLDPSTEVLVGGTLDGTYYRIDQVTGRTTMLGRFHRGSTTYSLSGDIVSVRDAATYVALRHTGTSEPDDLATLDVRTGEVSIVGSTGYRRMFGIGYWRATLYGFTRQGEVVAVDLRSGRSRLVSMPMPVVPFAGAGVTTVAPVAPP